MKYTVRYAHLASTDLKIGDMLSRGQKIGVMGSTGQSTGPHLHIDCIVGLCARRYTLHEIENGNPTPSPRQLNYFIDAELFDCPPIVTTPYADYQYQRDLDKVHCGYDVVPSKKENTTIYWNRSAKGTVIDKLVNDPGYGNCIVIAFDA